MTRNEGQMRGSTNRGGPALWDDLWRPPRSREEDLATLAREEASIRWRRIAAIVSAQFGSFEGLNVVELGAGAGTYSALMAKRGSIVTLIDYSEGALARAREFFERNGIAARFLRHDVLCLPRDLQGRFDVAMSFGLTEHFRGDNRLAANKAHFDLLRRGGLAFVSVPNRNNPPYRIFKLLAERSGAWRVGEEYPYSRGELEEICRRLGITDFWFIGDSFLGSWRFLDPVRIAKRLVGRKGSADSPKIRREWGTPLDPYLSYALVLCARSNPRAPDQRSAAVSET